MKYLKGLFGSAALNGFWLVMAGFFLHKDYTEQRFVFFGFWCLFVGARLSLDEASESYRSALDGISDKLKVIQLTWAGIEARLKSGARFDRTAPTLPPEPGEGDGAKGDVT